MEDGLARRSESVNISSASKELLRATETRLLESVEGKKPGIAVGSALDLFDDRLEILVGSYGKITCEQMRMRELQQRRQREGV